MKYFSYTFSSINIYETYRAQARLFMSLKYCQYKQYPILSKQKTQLKALIDGNTIPPTNKSNQLTYQKAWKQRAYK